MHKILVIRLSSIGDIILTTPLIRALRIKFPQARIDFATKKEFASLVQYNPHLNEIISVNTEDIQLARAEIIKNNYDQVLNIQKSSRASQLLWGVKRSKISTYSKDRLRRFCLINFKWNFYQEIVPVYLRYFNSAQHLGVDYDGQGTEVFLPSAEEQTISHLLDSFFIKSAGPLVAICPGASFANKRWTLDGFKQVMQHLNEVKSCRFLLLGGPGEKTLCTDLEEAMPPGYTINLAGKLSLLGTAAALSQTQVAITNDSGLLHLAQARKIPVVAIFGPTVREFGFYPLPEQSIILEHDIGCRPCTKMGLEKCPKGHHLCMRSITPEQVLEAVRQFLP